MVHFYFKDALYYTPRLSDQPGGRLYVRLPPDIARGGWVWPRRGVRRVRLPVRQLIGALKARLLRRTPQE